MSFFNHKGTRSRVEFEPVCALCGKAPEESDHVQDTLPASVTMGKVPLPICRECHDSGKKAIFVTLANNVTAELGRKENKEASRTAAKEAKAAVVAAAAAAAAAATASHQTTPSSASGSKRSHKRQAGSTRPAPFRAGKEPAQKRQTVDLHSYLSPATPRASGVTFRRVCGPFTPAEMVEHAAEHMEFLLSTAQINNLSLQALWDSMAAHSERLRETPIEVLAGALEKMTSTHRLTYDDSHAYWSVDCFTS